MADIARVSFAYGSEQTATPAALFTVGAGQTVIINDLISCSAPGGGTFSDPTWVSGSDTSDTIVALKALQTFGSSPYIRSRWYAVLNSTGASSGARNIQANWTGCGTYYQHQISIWVLSGCNTSTQSGNEAASPYGSSGQTRTVQLTQGTNSSAICAVCADGATAPTIGSFFGTLETLDGTWRGGFRANAGDTTGARDLTFGGTSGDWWVVYGIEIINASPASSGGFAPRAARSNQMAL